MRPSTRFLKQARVGPPHSRYGKLRMTDDLEARHVVTDGGKPGDPDVLCLSIDEVMAATSVDQWDLVKLNIEGAECAVLQSWPGPIAKQIVVSWHEHTPQKVGGQAIANAMQHLSQWYRVVRHEWDERFCAGYNFWDSVMVLRDIL